MPKSKPRVRRRRPTTSKTRSVVATVTPRGLSGWPPTSNTLDLLHIARQRLIDPTNWASGSDDLDTQGKRTDRPYGAAANTLFGALLWAVDDSIDPTRLGGLDIRARVLLRRLVDALVRVLPEAFREPPPSEGLDAANRLRTFNENSRHPDIIALFDRAISAEMIEG